MELGEAFGHFGISGEIVMMVASVGGFYIIVFLLTYIYP